MENRAGTFDDVILGGGVSFEREYALESGSNMPIGYNPGDTYNPALDQDAGVQSIEDVETDAAGFSRNSFLERTRNQNPFVPIDPPLVQVRGFVLNSAGSLNIDLPYNCQAYRLSYVYNNLAAILVLTRGAASAIGTANGVFEGELVNPANIWRACRGGQVITLTNAGASGRVTGSVEFFIQL